MSWPSGAVSLKTSSKHVWMMYGWVVGCDAGAGPSDHPACRQLFAPKPGSSHVLRESDLEVAAAMLTNMGPHLDISNQDDFVRVSIDQLAPSST